MGSDLQTHFGDSWPLGLRHVWRVHRSWSLDLLTLISNHIKSIAPWASKSTPAFGGLEGANGIDGPACLHSESCNLEAPRYCRNLLSACAEFLCPCVHCYINLYESIWIILRCTYRIYNICRYIYTYCLFTHHTHIQYIWQYCPRWACPPTIHFLRDVKSWCPTSKPRRRRGVRKLKHWMLRRRPWSFSCIGFKNAEGVYCDVFQVCDGCFFFES